ncbi:hypothetical protein CYQ88_04285 [Hydrogenovibrio sp. SC-1]|uniref:diguanylate cyclase n=1 Tax=Hydrogenovibrio sp. SC-1 TaxID=2065820 RepID=UPI000C7A1565|nr:diguanylate cyclase [Hydrogenovibrio sp. SC-1]PLA74814.1 hypothetical protein CYQ88_04285 [Hydrogenovibrio sp. SC-1]
MLSPSWLSYLVSKRFLFAIVLFCSGALVTIYSVYQWKIENTRQQEFQFYKAHLNDELAVLIQGKAEITQAIAVSITTLPVLKQALQSQDIPIQPILAAYSQRLKEQTPYKEVWIQLVDAKGVSLARSWTQRKNDDLSQIRRDIASLLQQPRYMNNFSVGKFALTFKSLVPLYDDRRQLMGILEVISHVNSIDRMLAEANGVRSVVLVNRDYRAQLTRSKTGKFIGDYYVANDAVSESDMALIDRLGVEAMFEDSQYRIFDGQLLISHPIEDLQGQRMANWVSVLPLSDFQFVNLQQTQRQIVLISAFIIVLVLLLVAVVHFKRQTEFERRFFFEVFDTATEMVFVVKSQRMLLANRRFFEFFSQFKTVEDFHQHHDCICEFFVSETGYLSQFVNGDFWLDYLVKHKDQVHYAKVKQQDAIYIFLVKATEITNVQGERYISVLMSDVTEEYRYKNKLEQLIIQDELTGIYNRHYFNQVLNQEIKRHQRYQTPLSMAFIDIDHFKNINDHYGHDVGDEVLKTMTNTICNELRDTDVFCRVGGEEFVVMMPQTTLQNAMVIAERMRQSVEILHFEQLQETVTISIGLVELFQTESSTAFYKRADNALYQAKESGRNQVKFQSEI